MCSTEESVSFVAIRVSVDKVGVVGRVAVRARVRDERRRTSGWR